jgi:hypothetical protein
MRKGKVKRASALTKLLPLLKILKVEQDMIMSMDVNVTQLEDLFGDDALDFGYRTGTVYQYGLGFLKFCSLNNQNWIIRAAPHFLQSAEKPLLYV